MQASRSSDGVGRQRRHEPPGDASVGLATVAARPPRPTCVVRRFGTIQTNAATVPPCARSVDSPSVPSCPRCSSRWPTWRATCAGPGTRRPRTSSPRWTRRRGTPWTHDPVRLLGAVGRERWTELAADDGFVQRLERREGRPRRATCPPIAGTSARPAPTRPARSPTSPRSSASPPCCRSTPAASASSPATTSRPPATSASRSSASACSTRAATSSSRCRARAGSRRPTRSSTPTSCRCRCCARPTAPAPRSPIEMPGGPDLVARIWVAQVGRVPLLLLDSDVEGNPDHYREVTDRLYGGTKEHRLRQELLLGVGGVRALRAYSRITGAPAPGGLPHQRGPRRLPRPGADPRAHGRPRRPEPRLGHRPRGLPRVAPSSPPTRRCRPASTASRASWSSSTSAAQRPDRRRPVESVLALGHRGLRGRRPDGLQHGRDGLPPRRSAPTASPCCTATSAARCSTACGRPSTRPRCRSARSPTACTRPTWVAREVIELAAVPRRRPRRRRRRRVLQRGRRGAGHRDLGGQARAARAPGPRRPPPADQVRARPAASPRPSSAGWTTSSTPTC